MTKEYTKITRQIYDENMQPIGEVEEVILTSLIADTGKKIKQLSTGILGVRVDIGDGDSEENYEEVDDPNYVEVISAIESEVSGNV